MRVKVASIVFAGAGLIACSKAWSWTMDGGKFKFSDRDFAMCKILEHDAAVIILNRQRGSPLDFPRDAESPPAKIQKLARANMILEAQAIPVESTLEKQMAVGEQFTKRALVNCLRFLRDTQPEDKP